MQPGPPAPGMCARCGGPNPPQSSFCQFCGAPLTGPVLFVPPPPSQVPPGYFSPAPPNRDEHEGPGLVLLVIGILLIVVGLVLFAVAAVVHDGVQSFNNACSQNPTCTPQSDPSGAFTAAGVGILVLGIILTIAGAVVYRGS